MSQRNSSLRPELASGGRRESIGRVNPRQVSISDPPAVHLVTVAVLPPRLATGVGVGPRTGVGMADAFNWDEAINWTLPEGDRERNERKLRSKNPFKRSLTTARQKANPDLPPFVMRQVPYEVWRKHYAKDKEGNYKGTHAPAEDCLLRPHDVDKWKFKGDGGDGEGAGWSSKFTRGKEALPVYGEVANEGMAPGYEADYDANVYGEERKEDDGDDRREPYDRPPPLEEPILEEDEEAHEQTRPQQQEQHKQQLQVTPPPPPPPTPLEQGQATDPNTGLPYDAQGEREALAARNSRSEGWKVKLKRGIEMAGMGQ